jgi:phytoene dehydrogenase-like protein
MEKSVIIIGGGIAGLSAGCYGQMNGYKTQIFEMHDRPGGVCTSWERKGYIIDGCVHWLVGSSPEATYHAMWEELGAVQGRQFVYFEEFRRIEDEHGNAWILYSDLDRLEEHMIELAPEDTKVIREFLNGARHILRRAFAASFADVMEEFPILARQGTLAYQHTKQAGYPIGGSLEFAWAIERRYLGLGGEVHYRSPVAKILVENGRAVGVRLRDGTECRGDIVISAADGHSTIFDMLDGRFIDDKRKGYYEKLALFPPLVYIGLGVARSFAGQPHEVVYMLDEAIPIGNRSCDRLCVNFYSYDPTFAPSGKTALTVLLYADYDYWQKLRVEDRPRYTQEKEKAAEQVIAYLDKRFPGLAGQVEMRDVATPATWKRYTGNWRGAWEGWLPTGKTFLTQMSKELPGLKNFYMVGQWVEPGGGLPTAAACGRNAVQIICKRDGREFTATLP